MSHDFLDLPGADLIEAGLRDYSEDKISLDSCLIAIARTRLNQSGVPVPLQSNVFHDPEAQLYELLVQEGGDAYSRYNALIRRLIRFEHAAEARFHRRQSAA